MISAQPDQSTRSYPLRFPLPKRHLLVVQAPQERAWYQALKASLSFPTAHCIYRPEADSIADDIGFKGFPGDRSGETQ